MGAGLGEVLRFSEFYAVPVSVNTATVTLVEAGGSTFFVRGLQNRTGGDIYFSYRTSAPADNTTMILLATGSSIFFNPGDNVSGNLYVYHSQGSAKTVHALKGV